MFALVGGRGSGGSQIRAIGVGLALGVLMDTGEEGTERDTEPAAPRAADLA